jgi:hypothetical protein
MAASTEHSAAGFEAIPLERAKALAELTELLESHEQFSYLRMGDGELRFLLHLQQGRLESITRTPEHRSIELSRGCPGIEPEHGDRLLRSYEQCDYLDWYWNQEYNRNHNRELVLRAKSTQVQKESIEDTGLLTDWTWFEFPEYIQRHRVVICGAEAALLGELLQDPDYRQIAGRFFDHAADCRFVQPAGEGRNLSQNLDEIKAQIAATVRESGADTVFVSLGGAAKIVAQELAEELRIRAIDFGSMLRSLSYSGSAGHAFWRADHLPYFFHVPFRTYMRAYRNAFPQAASSSMLLKAQCQVCLEVQRKHPRLSIPSDAIDSRNYHPTVENLARFNEAYHDYRRHYRWRGLLSREGLRLLVAFEWWIIKKQLGWKGRLFGLLQRLRRRLIPDEQWRRIRTWLSNWVGRLPRLRRVSYETEGTVVLSIPSSPPHGEPKDSAKDPS